MKTMCEWMWWIKGKCVVKVLSIGHFPDTVMVQLPDDKTTEVAMNELTVDALNSEEV